jgi:hypothetical protein
MRALVVGVVLTGCALPAEKQSPDLTCSGKDLPMTADPTVTFSGRVIEAFSTHPVPGVQIEAHVLPPPSIDTPLFTTTADGAGHFSEDQRTLGLVRELYLRTTPSSYLETRYYPAVAVAHDLTTDIQLFTTDNLGPIADVIKITPDLTKANLLVTTVDCNDHTLARVTIATEPAGSMLYITDPLAPGATMTDELTGTVLVANVPPGPITITGTLDDEAHTQLRPHTFTAAAGVITQAEIQP